MLGFRDCKTVVPRCQKGASGCGGERRELLVVMGYGDHLLLALISDVLAAVGCRLVSGDQVAAGKLKKLKVI